MDGSRFDGFVRALATGQTRRRTLQGLAGGALAGLLAYLGLEDSAAGCVKPGTPGCKGPRNKKCCTGARCQRGSKEKAGTCTCKGSLKKCGRTCVNTKTDKTNCGGCNLKCPRSNTCKNRMCTTKLGCRAGINHCTDFAKCPGSNNPNCFCSIDVEGTTRCANFAGRACSNCTSNTHCGVGFVCIGASGVHCGCSGNACVQATCDGGT